MHCDDARRQLDALHDGSLDAEMRDAVDAHLASCPDCQTAAADVARFDAYLRRAFAPRRDAVTAIADRALAQLVLAPRRISGPRIAALVAAAAAGFLLAVAIFRPWQKPPVERIESPRDFVKAPPSDAPSVQLAIATGAVECESGKSWEAVATGGKVPLGCPVRTQPGVRCEFRSPDGSEVRLNGGTEVVFRGPRQVQLVRGQVWSTVAVAPEPYRVDAPVATVTALGTQFDLLHDEKQSRLTVVSGRTRVEAGKATREVSAGEYMDLDPKLLSEPQKKPQYQLLQATGWVTEILRLKGHGNPELTRRIDDLFAQIGQTKTDHLAEDEIRLLGDHCVLPLTRYLQSERSRGEPYKRQVAARILADFAQPWSIKDLIGLLKDDEAEVRVEAARALRRLTGQTQDLDPGRWRIASPEARQQALDRWQTWWEQNQFRCPTEPPGPAGQSVSDASQKR
jgi:ferric-dicitrate binding protein FerR (iron transport regulator)